MSRPICLALFVVGACVPPGGPRDVASPPGTIATPAAHDHEHEHVGAPVEMLGTVHFPVSCSPEAQPRFDRAMALLHSFWWSEAHVAFDAVLEADPRCAMGYWGQAMAWRGNPFTPIAPAALEAGLAAAERALALGPPTERELGFVRAALALFRDHPDVDQRSRSLAHEVELERLHREYPDDQEAAIFYALALTINAPPTDLEFERQRRAGAILEPLFRATPDHPGLAHYLIHAYDSPHLARLGVDAALQYSQIAPTVPHAQHMPSHIFTRLGMWEESIAANRVSADAAVEYEELNRSPNLTMDRVHASDYLVYAHLQRGETEKALRVIDSVLGKPAGVNLAIDYGLAAMPARYSLERGDWRAAARLEPRHSAQFPATEAITHFARGIGAARTGELETARGAVAELETVRSGLERGGDHYWAQVVVAQSLAIQSWIAKAEGRTAEARGLAAAAAEMEEQAEKHPVTPGPILPARELEGDLLLELGAFRDALRSYEATLEREPNRARATFGAGRAAELAGDHAAANRYFSAFASLMSGAEVESPEITAARAFLSRR
jgi:tetratricopeptide (TPR) repeat protein